MTLLMLIDWIFGIYMGIGLAMMLMCDCIMRNKLNKFEGSAEHSKCIYNCYANGFTCWIRYEDILHLIAMAVAWPVCYPIRMTKFFKEINRSKAQP